MVAFSPAVLSRRHSDSFSPRRLPSGAAPTDDGFVIREIWLLRLHALLARAQGDEAAYRDYRDRYRAMATSLGFEGHTKWAEAMT